MITMSLIQVHEMLAAVPGQCQIQVVVDGKIQYVYLGTTTTQLYFDPMIGVDVNTPTADNKASKQTLSYGTIL